MIFGIGSKKAAVDFEPSTDVFPAIAVKPIAKSLRLQQRGREDGKRDYPASGASDLTTAEQDAISDITRLRKRGIDAFDMHFTAYANRIELGAGALHRIETQAGKLKNEMVSESRTQKNIAMNRLRDVQESSRGLKAYQERHRLTQPPEQVPAGVFQWLLIILFFCAEVTLGAAFFSENSPAGLIGSAAYSMMIAFMNVGVSGLLGFGTRYASLKGFGYKILGTVSLLFFIAFALVFNVFVGHFRKATDEMAWEDAGTAMVESFRANPFDLGSFNAILIAAFGILIAILSFLKFLKLKDIHPGYNKAYDRVREAIDAYADAYENTEEKLNELFEESQAALMAEALQLRAAVRDASSAHSGQVTLLANLNAFLAESEQVANGLLRTYREANEQARSDEAPEYFHTRHAFPIQPQKEVTPLGVLRIEEEIKQINAAASVGVSAILEARRQELGALPTTDQLIDDLNQGVVPEPVREGPLELVSGGRS